MQQFLLIEKTLDSVDIWCAYSGDSHFQSDCHLWAKLKCQQVLDNFTTFGLFQKFARRFGNSMGLDALEQPNSSGL